MRWEQGCRASPGERRPSNATANSVPDSVKTVISNYFISLILDFSHLQANHFHATRDCHEEESNNEKLVLHSLLFTHCINSKTSNKCRQLGEKSVFCCLYHELGFGA